MLVLLWCLVVPQEASAQAQCGPGNHALVKSLINWNPTSVGAEFETQEVQNCNDWTVSTFMWFAGAGYIFCQQGVQEQTYCYKFSNAWSIVEGYLIGTCGVWLAEAGHQKIDSNFISYQIGTSSGNVSASYNCTPPYVNTQEVCENDPWYGIWEEMGPEPLCFYSPILVPLSNKKNIKLTSVEAGVQFDMDGDGIKEQVAWVDRDSRFGFLFIDRNENGIVDNGRELFGNFTVPGSHNGFDALQRLNQLLGQTELVPFIEEGQPLYPHLKIWDDANNDGVSTPEEVQPASNILSQIGLGYQPTSIEDRHGNKFAFKGFGFVRTGHGRNYTRDMKEQHERTVPLYDVFFAGRPIRQQ